MRPCHECERVIKWSRLNDLFERYPEKPSYMLSTFCAGLHPSAISPPLFGSRLRPCCLNLISVSLEKLNWSTLIGEHKQIFRAEVLSLFSNISDCVLTRHYHGFRFHMFQNNYHCHATSVSCPAAFCIICLSLQCNFRQAMTVPNILGFILMSLQNCRTCISLICCGSTPNWFSICSTKALQW